MNFIPTQMNSACFLYTLKLVRTSYFRYDYYQNPEVWYSKLENFTCLFESSQSLKQSKADQKCIEFLL